MLKIMVVEDDVLYRQKIASLLDWQALGYTVAGQAINGRDALEQFEKQPVDLILTDISMPQMDGVELIQRVKQLAPRTVILVLSAFDDFHFVKDAMKHGAKDYLLKQDLDRSLGQLAALLEDAKTSLADVAADAALPAQDRRLLVEASLRGLLERSDSDAYEIEQRLRRHMVFFPFTRYLTCVVQARHARVVVDMERPVVRVWQDEEKRAFQEALRAREQGGDCLVFFYKEDSAVCLLDCGGVFSDSRLKSRAQNLWNALAGPGFCAAMGVGGIQNGLAALPLGYSQACDALENTAVFSGGSPSFFHPGELPALPAGLEELLEGMEKSALGRREQALAGQTAGLQQFLEEKSLTRRQMDLLCARLTVLLRRLCEQNGTELAEASPYGEIPAQLALHCDAPATLVRFVGACLERAALGGGPALQSSNPYVRKIVQYVAAHYMEPITLAGLGRELGLSETYVSNLFKQETGSRLLEYVADVRLGHARLLMKNTDIKVQEIARYCGFTSTAHFSKVFKAKTGMTFTQYREANRD